jgi:hypothetical protein
VETPDIIAALLAKRSEIQKAIALLQRKERKHKADMAQLDATIRLFAPSVTLVKREVMHWSRSVHFVTGELTRRCQQALREANGAPFTADEITILAMKEKGLEVGDGELRADITRRFLWTLNRMMGRKMVVKQGCGQVGIGSGRTMDSTNRGWFVATPEKDQWTTTTRVW